MIPPLIHPLLQQQLDRDDPLPSPRHVPVGRNHRIGFIGERVHPICPPRQAFYSAQGIVQRIENVPEIHHQRVERRTQRSHATRDQG